MALVVLTDKEVICDAVVKHIVAVLEVAKNTWDGAVVVLGQRS